LTPATGRVSFNSTNQFIGTRQQQFRKRRAGDANFFPSFLSGKQTDKRFLVFR
jgi:hypothetical protein